MDNVYVKLIRRVERLQFEINKTFIKRCVLK